MGSHDIERPHFTFPKDSFGSIGDVHHKSKSTTKYDLITSSFLAGNGKSDPAHQRGTAHPACYRDI